MDNYLHVIDVSKRFGESTVLDNLSLVVRRGEFVSLLGPSGCGKTTLLRLIAGLLPTDGGRIVLDGKDLTRLPAHRRNVGVVFQNYALFPHLTVAENVAFGLRARGVAKQEIPAIVERCLAMVHLADYADRSIFALSGGQQQRVAVARAIAIRPDLLLLDEPFSALDRKLREAMQIELRQLLRELGITAIFVTHDQEEAMIMSDRIAVMNAGVIEQFADPRTVYERPATAFALEFVGTSTRLPGRVSDWDGDTVLVDTAAGPIRARAGYVSGAPVMIGIRPEKIMLADGNEHGMNVVRLRVLDRVYVGSKLLLHFDAGSGGQALAELNPGDAPDVAPGDMMSIAWRVEDTLIYPAVGHG